MAQTQTQLKLDGYIRVSRVGGREGESYRSPTEQKEAIKSYAAELGGKIVRWHEDEDVSGGTLDRPGLNAALERLRTGKSEGLVTYDVSRFARRVEAAALIREITERGQVFASCNERIDPKTWAGRQTLSIFLAIAEGQREQLSERWVSQKEDAVSRGVHIGPTPIGYQRPNKGARLVADPITGPAIRELFERAATREHGDSALAQWFTERVPGNGNGRRPYQPSEIRRWLGNRVYLGEVHYGDLVNAEAHEPLTDPETWRRCQRDPGKQRRASSPFLLSGLVRCAHCRYALSGQTGGGADGKTPVYRCGNGCEGASVITADRLEAHVRELAVERLRTIKLEAAEDGIDLARLDRELQEAERLLAEFASDVGAQSALGTEAYADGLRLRAATRDAAREAREQGYERAKLEAVSVEIEKLDRHELRDLLSGLVETIFVRRRGRGATAADRTRIVWTGEIGDLELPGPRRSGVFEPVTW